MDFDHYLAIHQPSWERLDALTKNGRKTRTQLDAAQVNELVHLYRATSTDLSYVRTYVGDPALVTHLSKLVNSARHVIYGTRPRTSKSIAHFFKSTFPVSVWEIRRFVLISAVLFLLPAAVVGAWIGNSPEISNQLMSPSLRDAYLNHDFESYYESERASEFASGVFTNNATVSFVAFASGVFFCVPTIFMLVFNGLNLGFAAGMFAAFGEQAKFWTLITPHGLLEITSLIIAGGTGLSLGWALIDPGDIPRSQSLAKAARQSISIVIGLVCAFLVAGIIEGFVTGQPWSAWIRVGIGAVVWIAFCAYIVVRGRKGSLTTLTAT